VLKLEDLVKLMSRLHTLPNGKSIASLMEQEFIDYCARLPLLHRIRSPRRSVQ
jgi:hypothetical protein